MEDTKDEPPNEGKINKIKIIVPNLFKKDSVWYAYCFGSIPTNILPPSKGWIGIRLKIASETFKITNGTAIMAKIGINLAIIERVKARIKFEAGPAKEIIAESLLGFFKLY